MGSSSAKDRRNAGEIGEATFRRRSGYGERDMQFRLNPEHTPAPQACHRRLAAPFYGNDLGFPGEHSPGVFGVASLHGSVEENGPAISLPATWTVPSASRVLCTLTGRWFPRMPGRQGHVQASNIHTIGRVFALPQITAMPVCSLKSWNTLPHFTAHESHGFIGFSRSSTLSCALVDSWKQTRNCHPNVRARQLPTTSKATPAQETPEWDCQEYKLSKT